MESIRVLIIEDSDDDALMVVRSLSKLPGSPFRPVAASTVAEGVQRLEAEGADAVLLDLRLPDTVGLEALSRVQRARPGVPIVVLSGLDDEAIALEAVRAGAQDYLFKRRASGDLLAHSIRYAIERKRIETQLSQAMQAAESAARLKSEFVAHLSHEIRTPLNAVLGTTSLLLATRLDPEQQEFLETIRSSGSHLLSVISDILDLSKIESGRLDLEPGPFDLRTLLEDSLDLVGPRAAEKKLELTYLLEPGTPTSLRGDVGRIRQVLVNLLNNAVKFTASGDVSVRVDGAQRDTGVWEARFRVSDTGIGIPPGRYDRLFQPFSQVDASTTRSYGGTGLGLAISKRLIEQMGGGISFESREGSGSTFAFSLPLERRTEGAPSAPGPRLGQTRLLVHSSNANVRRMVQLHLEALGGSPDMFDDWSKLEDALASAATPGTVVTDATSEAIQAVVGPLVIPPTVIQLAPFGRPGATAAPTPWTSLSKPLKLAALHDALFHIPAELAEHRAGGRPLLSPEIGREWPLRILVVEDNPVSQRMTQAILNKMGYQPDVAATGREAVDAANRAAYDLILMDLEMPEMDGLEATRRIRERWPVGRRPQIVAMTAHSTGDNRARCLEAGMNEYLSKPMDVARLVQVLRQFGTPAKGETRPVAVQAGTLRQLYEDLGDETIAGQLVDAFLDETPRLIEQLWRAAQAADRPHLRRLAHTLKATSATFGAFTLSQQFGSLERLSLSGPIEAIQVQAGAAQEQYASVRKALEAERRRILAPARP